MNIPNKANNINTQKSYSHHIINKMENNNINKGFFCSRCYSLDSINVNKNKKTEEIFIQLTCQNKHTENISLNNFLKDIEKYNNKICPVCQISTNINNFLYCFSCKKIFCSKCMRNNVCHDKHHKIGPLTSKNRKCLVHNYKINQFYCITCRKYICQECFSSSHTSHKVSNIYINVNKFKNKLKCFIESEEKNNKNQLQKCNNIIVKIRNRLNELIEYKNNVLKIKKGIINSYEINMDSFNILQNMGLIQKDFCNKKKLDNHIKKLCKKFDIINDSNNIKKTIKININNEKSNMDKNNNINKSNSNKNVSNKIINNDKDKEERKLNNSIKSNSNSLFKTVTNSFNSNINKSSINYNKNNIKFKVAKLENFVNINKDNNNNDNLQNNNILNKETIIDERSKSNMSMNSIEEKNNPEDMSPPPFILNCNCPIKTDSNNPDSNINMDNYFNKIINKASYNNNINSNNTRKEYYKIISTKKNIKNIFCLSHRNIIISYDILKYNNLSLYKMIYDQKEYVKLKHLNNINIYDEPVNDINQYSDNTILLCTNNCIAKVKINNHENGEYLLVFRYVINYKNISDNIFLFDSNFKLCLPLSNKNFITCSQSNTGLYWTDKTSQNLNLNGGYRVEKLNIINYIIFSMKEISENSIVLGMEWRNKNYQLYYLLYIDINENNTVKTKMNKQILYELNNDKNCIQKINNEYFLVVLKRFGFVIINYNTKEIIKKFIDENTIFAFLESKLIDDYLYYFVIEKKNEDNKLIFKKYKSLMSEYLLNGVTKLIPGKNFFLNFKNKFNKIGIILEKVKTNNILTNDNSEKDVYSTEVVIVVGENKLIIFNYYS